MPIFEKFNFLGVVIKKKVLYLSAESWATKSKGGVSSLKIIEKQKSLAQLIPSNFGRPSLTCFTNLLKVSVECPILTSAMSPIMSSSHVFTNSTSTNIRFFHEIFFAFFFKGSELSSLSKHCVET